jgi:hypothetical protein
MSDLSIRGRIGAHTLHATHDSRQITASARQAFLSKFEREVDPDGVLTLDERRRRAGHALKAHMARLALRSAKERHRRVEEQEEARFNSLAFSETTVHVGGS